MYIKDIKKFKESIILNIKKLIRYHDVGYILDHLESLIILPVPIVNPKADKIQYNENRNLYEETFENTVNSYEDFDKEISLREEIFDYLRTINPDFGLKMNEKLPKKDYNRYAELIMKFPKDLSKVSKQFQKRENDYNELILSQKDLTSQIIDSPDYSELANIEDMFMLDELSKISSEKITDSDMLEKITNLEKQLQQRVENYKLYTKLNSKDNKIIIKLENKINKVNDER